MRTKIKTLMSIYRISNIVLARGVGADPSLISRWRSGEREPSEEMLRGIAGFLSNQQMLAHDRDALSQTVCAPCTGSAETAAAVFAWLAGEGQAGFPEEFSAEEETPAPEPDRPPAPPPPVTELSVSGDAPPLQWEREWMGWMPLARCVPRVYSDARAAMDIKTRMLTGAGMCVLHKTSLSGFFLPPEVIRTRYPLTERRQNEQLLEMRSLFERHAAAAGWIEFLPLTLVDAISINGSCAIPGFEVFERKGLTLSGDALRATLQVIRACLERYPHFRIVWTEQPAPQDVCVSGEGDALYVSHEPFSAVHISVLPKETDELPVPSGDRGSGLLDEMIESLLY